MCFRRKKASEKVIDNRELISTNERSIESLIVLARDDEELIQKFRRLQEKLKYLTPSKDGKVIDYDKKIKNLIEDLRIVLVKADGEPMPPKGETLLRQIELAIADRNAKV